MTELLEPAIQRPARFALPVGAAPALFGGAVFASASLVFLVQPMVARLVLPTLGGSPAVWNTSMAFFQAALLAGYAYAHLLQRVRDARLQGAIHVAALLAAGLLLPLRVTDAFGAAPPGSADPALWLVGVLALSIGLPFAVLSATAPLLQAWYARVRAGKADAANPYVLYAASNFGSLIALLAYPLVVEPYLRLHTQTTSWSALYGAFVLVMAAVAWSAARAGSAPAPAQVQAPGGAKPAMNVWRERLIWLALAAAPSSLMLGVTSYATTDVASAPFLWVVPLALYLVTFIIAFQAKPLIAQSRALRLHGVAAPAAAFTLTLPTAFIFGQMGLHFAAFFLTALVCHQALAARRPSPERLTEFYLVMSAGGVIGGAFNAFAAPLLFDGVFEYPLVLALACLARPVGQAHPRDRVVFLAGLAAIAGATVAAALLGPGDGPKWILALAAGAAALTSAHPVRYFVLVAALLFSGMAGQRGEVMSSDRSFFGVLRVMRANPEGLGEVRVMMHGTTVHGAQALAPESRCSPTTYYALATPIGQTFTALQARQPALSIGAIGMGAGTVATYVRTGDRMRFFEIDPLVVRAANDPKQFSYINGCARGPIDTVLGDARLSIASEAPGAYDLLLVDAFSSDAVPAHLLTVEAIRLYLDRIKPDGVVVMHLSNRNLELLGPVGSALQAAGAYGMTQRFRPKGPSSVLSAASTDVMLVAKSGQALAPFRNDPRWTPAKPGAPYWTDDYTNLFGAMARKLTAGPAS